MPDGSNPFKPAAKKAALKANEQLQAEEAKVQPISWAEIREMLPDKLEQQQLDELIQIVNGATSHNEKVAALIKNIGKLSNIVVKVLSKVP